MAILGLLQSSIEELHAIETELDVHAYVVDDETRSSIPGCQHGLPEQLFIREDEEGMELALYIDSGIVERLEIDHPHRRLHDGNLEQYCIALEGVSHFVFLAWRAQVGRPVSALELEIQAEVDKFVTAWLLLADQGFRLEEGGEVLTRRLFDGFEVREEVPAEEVERYHLANRSARLYCRDLVRRFRRMGDESAILADVRRFYRRGLAEKMRAA